MEPDDWWGSIAITSEEPINSWTVDLIPEFPSEENIILWIVENEKVYCCDPVTRLGRGVWYDSVHRREFAIGGKVKYRWILDKDQSVESQVYD